MWTNKILEQHQDESALVHLLAEIEDKKAEFTKRVAGMTYRGNPYGFGGMRPEVSTRLYGLIREFKPRTLIETGVCNGVSTAVILAALEMNHRGDLFSIDLPEYSDTDYKAGTFWDGKKGAVIPKGSLPGWLIPVRYRDRWHLTIGRSQDELPRLLTGLGHIDFFLHDSEHSYECMTFEYQLAWKYLDPGGLLVSDDIKWNSSFEDFARQHSREMNVIDRNMAFIFK